MFLMLQAGQQVRATARARAKKENKRQHRKVTDREREEGRGGKREWEEVRSNEVGSR